MKPRTHAPAVHMRLLMLMLLLTSMLPPVTTAPFNAALSATQENNGITATLYVNEPVKDVTIDLIDQDGKLYILPGEQLREDLWRAHFPITPKNATLRAYAGAEKLAEMHMTPTQTEQETIKPETTSTTTPADTTSAENITTTEPVTARPVRPGQLSVSDKRGTVPARIERFGKDRVRIRPEGHPIKEMIIDRLTSENELRLSTPPIKKLPSLTEPVAQTYAIDPAALTFTEADVTVTAKGTRLYKCAEWNYDMDTCEGSWQLQRSITPGENYTITVTPTDPAYVETTVLAMEWGVITSLNDTWQTINLTYEYADPVIIITQNYEKSGVPTVTRIDNVEAGSFQARLQMAGSGAATPRTSYYLVIEAGNWTLPGGRKMEAYTYTSTTTDENNDWSPDSLTYVNNYTNPVVLAQVMSTNDTRWSTMWVSGGSTTTVPDSNNLYMSKHVGEDPVTARADETVGYFVIEEGHGNLSSIEYDAFLTTKFVRGVDDSPPYTTSFTQTFPSAPTVMFTTIAGMGGVNGGWTNINGSATSSQISLVVDEDQANDMERNHATEYTGVLAFHTPGSYLENEAPTISGAILDKNSAQPGETVILNVTIADAQGPSSVPWVNVTLRFPNGTETNLSMTQYATGSNLSSNDQVTTQESGYGMKATIIGETGIIKDVNSWETVTFRNTYNDPHVFAFTLNQSDINNTVQQALATVTNVTTNDFQLSVILPDNNFTTDDVGYVVLENGTWVIEGTTIQSGLWTYSGTAFTTKYYHNPFSSTATTFLQLQNKDQHWYTGRYEDASRTSSSIQIQYEDNSNTFSGNGEVAYLAFEEGEHNGLFEGNLETGISEDEPGEWHPISFTRDRNEPIFMGIISDAGGDPAKLGTGSLNSSNVNVRVTEDTFSDAEQAHSTDEALWMVFNGSQTLYDDTSHMDNDEDKTVATYNDVMSDNMITISQISVSLNVTGYNNSGSAANYNANPTLELYLNTENGWVSIGEKAFIGPEEKTWTTLDSTILTDWRIIKNRDIRVDINKVDYVDPTHYDNITWNDLVVTMQGGDPTSTWRLQMKNTDATGTYNITRITTTDTIENVSANYTNLTFTIADTLPPTLLYFLNQTFNTGQPIDVTFTATDPSGLDTWTVNDSSFDINAGRLTNATVLAEKTYWLNITVNDTVGNTKTGKLKINITSVPDTTPPVFVPALTNTTIDYGTALSFDINATDDRGRLDTFSVNDTNFTIDTETGVLENATFLTQMRYKLSITVNDTAGNQNTSFFIVYQTDTMPPSITVTNQTSEFGQPFSYSITASDNLGIDSYWLTGTTDLAINGSGTITNVTGLIKNNIYLMIIHVNDTSGLEDSEPFTITVQDTTPPAATSGLTVKSTGKQWISWTWTDPADSDYNTTLIYINGSFTAKTNTSTYNATGLLSGELYEIGTRTSDIDGNENTTWQNSTAKTDPNQAPTINVLSPINITHDNDGNQTITLIYNDSDDNTACVSITSGTDLIMRNCSAKNATPIIYDWKIPPLADDANTEVLYHFDQRTELGENANLVNDYATGSQNNFRNCTLTCPTFVENGGIIAGAYYYDGNNDHYHIEESYFNDAFNTKTFETWFKADTTSGTRYLYEEGGSTNGMAVRINSGRLEYATRTTQQQHTISTPFTDTATWHYVVTGYDNGNMTLYLDGTMVNTTSTSADYTTIATHSDDGGIGATVGSDAFGLSGGPSSYFKGYIDEMRFTTVAPNATEIVRNMQLNGTYTYHAEANDTLLASSTDLYSFVADITPPRITQNKPGADWINETTKSITYNFSATVTDDIELARARLYLTNSTNGSFSLNGTTNVKGTLDEATLYVTLGPGSYTWNYLVIDEGNNTVWGENRTLTVLYTEYDGPNISIITPTGKTYNVTETITINANITDKSGVANAWANITYPNTTIETLMLMPAGGTLWKGNYTIPLLNGTYTVTVLSNDTFSNIGNASSTFTAIYNTTLTIGENTDPVANGEWFTVWANYTYPDRTPVTGASCTILALNKTIVGYYSAPEDDIETLAGNGHYDAVTFEHVNNNQYNTLFELEMHLGYNGSQERNLNIWVTNDTATWDNTQPATLHLNTTTHPTIAETLSEQSIIIGDSNFTNEGNYTVIVSCPSCDANNRYYLGEDTNTFGHSQEIEGEGTLTWQNATEKNKEYMMELFVDHKEIPAAYNTTSERYEVQSRIWISKTTSFTYQWNATCNAIGHIKQQQTTSFTIVNKEKPEPNITSVNPSPAELGENITVTWKNDISGKAFDITTSYVNLTHANGTFIKQYLGGSFVLTKTELHNLGTYNLTAYAENDQGEGINTTSLLVQDTTAPAVTLISPNSQTYAQNDEITIKAKITDADTLSTTYAHITLGANAWNITLTDADNDTIYTGNFTNTTNTGTYNITIIANDTANSGNDTGNFTIITVPIITTIEPLAETYDVNEEIHQIITLSENATVTVKANTSNPAGNKTITQMHPEITSDGFDNNTEGTIWQQGSTLYGDQACDADIDTTQAGKAYVHLYGTSDSTDYSTCGLVSTKEHYLIKDFDINLTYNVTGIAEGMGIYLAASPTTTMKTTNTQVTIARTNTSYFGDGIIVLYVENGNITIEEFPEYKSLTGTLRIKREGDNFSFYLHNGTDMIQMPTNRSKFAFTKALHAQIGLFGEQYISEDYSATFESFNINPIEIASYATFFNETTIEGLYNITYTATDENNISSTPVKTNFTILESDDPPSTPAVLKPAPLEVVYGQYNVTWLEVFDEENDTLNYKIELLDTDDQLVSVLVNKLPDEPWQRTTYLWDTTAYTDDLYKIRVTVYENETVENLSNSDVIDYQFRIHNKAPDVNIACTNCKEWGENSRVHVIANVTDTTPITSVIARITMPNTTIQNITLQQSSLIDAFDNATGWNQDDEKDQTQTCTATINLTVPGKAMLNFQGTGTTSDIHVCAYSSAEDIYGDFDINITYNTTQLLPGTGIGLVVSESNATTFTNYQFAVTRYNSIVFGDDGILVSYNDNGTQSMTFSNASTALTGTLRIKRSDTNLTAYLYDGAMHAVPTSKNSFNFTKNLNVQFGVLKSGQTPFDVNATFDNLNGSYSSLYGGSFTETEEYGVYNYTIIAKNTYGRVNDSYNDNFTIRFINDPPSIPLILAPTPQQDVTHLFNISWTLPYDEENDNLLINITLLNSNGSENTTIATELAMPITSYLWNTSNYKPGTYNLRVTVYENETAEGNSNSDTVNDNFNIVIDNIIGDESSITTNSENITVSVGGTAVDVNGYYHNEQEVVITANSTKIINFTHNFNVSLNLSSIEIYQYNDSGVGIKVPKHTNITLYVPIVGSVCNVKICDGVTNKSGCTDQNMRKDYPDQETGLCPVKVNGTYAKDLPESTDFKVNETDIEFSADYAEENENITINVTTYNLGDTWADNVNISIYDSTTSTLLLEHIVTNFSERSNVTVTTSINVTTIDHLILVEIDGKNNFAESNETNNNATRWLNITSATVTTDASSYGAHATVTIKGNNYLASSDTTLMITETSTGYDAQYYPQIVTTNNTGGFLRTWDTSSFCEGSYTINATDATYDEVTDQTTFNILYNNYTQSDCTSYWGFDCGAGPAESGDNTWDACPTGTGGDESVEQITLNATIANPGDRLNVTCTYDPYTSQDYLNIWYYNGTGWRKLYNEGPMGSSSIIQRSVAFTVDNTTGTHYVRCMIDYQQNTATECANTGSWYDNDDLGFEVRETAESCENFDGMAPNTTLLAPLTSNYYLNQSVTIQANITDENGISKAYATITLPNNSEENVTLTYNSGTYQGTFTTTTQEGTYQVNIFANDTWSNVNDSAKGNFTVTKHPLSLTTNRDSYLRNEDVAITAIGFTNYANITVDILNSTGSSVSGYPKNITSLEDGSITDTWTVPGAQALGSHNITAIDTTNNTRSAWKIIDVVTAIIKTDATSYEQANTVLISGYSWDPGENVTINITDSFDQLVLGPLNLTANSTGEVNSSWFADYNQSIDTYKIYAIQPSNPSKNNTYSFAITRRPTPITTDWTWYTDEEDVHIIINGMGPNNTVRIDIKNATGSVAGYPKNVTANETGGANDTWTIPVGQALGSYTINATDQNYTNLHNATTLNIVQEYITTNNNAYKSGDTVTIKGYYFDRNSNVTIDIYNSTGTSSNGYPQNVSTAENGGFTHLWTAQPGPGLGITTYTINASTTTDQDNVSIDVTKAATLITDQQSYLNNSDVNITGDYYSPSGLIEINIISGNNGGSAYNYPTNITANTTGSIQNLWNTAQWCPGTYTVNTTDQQYPEQLYASTTFNIVYHDYTTRTCADTWGASCGGSTPDIDNTWDACPTGTGGDESVEQITLNATIANPGDRLNVTCTYDPYTSQDYLNIWYYNGTGWRKLYNEGPMGSSSIIQRSVAFTVDNTTGTHYVRCMIDYQQNTATECANTGTYYDNDDVAFTVAKIPDTCEEFDINAPNVTAVNPNNTYRQPVTIEISSNVSDEHNISKVYAVVTLPDANTSTIELLDGNADGKYNATFTELTQAGNYTVTIMANDSWRNMNDTQTTTFTVLRPDITVAAVNIGPETVTENTNITVNATISNDGSTWAENVLVRMIDNSTGDLIATQTYNNLTQSSNVTLSGTLIGTPGETRIDILTDPLNAIPESNEANNNASRWINISVWQTIYGDVDAILSLGNSSTFISWHVEDVSGNIYAHDADATINWGSLRALGRKKNNTTASADFTEADIFLNISENDNTVADRFSGDGSAPLDTRNLKVAGKTINDIPVINTTGMNNFITGILWDTTLDTNSEFDGEEDLVFFTPINSSQAGSYGTYDYELTFPVSLQKTRGNKDTIYLYTEIT